MSGLTLRNNDSGSKEIVQGGAARLRMLKGFESITETVASTLGPFGRSVIIEHTVKGAAFLGEFGAYVSEAGRAVASAPA